MKKCKRCKTEFQDNYDFCSKCGTSFINNKKPCYPDGFKKKFGTKILYILGVLLIIVNFSNLFSDFLFKFLFILFGISLLPIVYELIEDKFATLSQKTLKLMKILIPVALFITVCISSQPQNKNMPNNNVNSNKTEEIQDNSNKSSEQEKDTEQEKNNEKEQEKNTTEAPPKPVEIMTYNLSFNELGTFGKNMEFEGEDSIFYYFPSGTYKIEATNMKTTQCYLWVDYNDGYQNENFGTAYNNKEMLTFDSDKKVSYVTLDDSVHIYNANECNYKLSKMN